MAYILIVLTALIIVTVLTYRKFTRAQKSAVTKQNTFKILEIQVPKVEETHVEMQTAPLAAENMFASLPMLTGLSRPSKWPSEISLKIVLFVNSSNTPCLVLNSSFDFFAIERCIAI